MKDRRNWLIFGLFALLIFVQTLLFDHFAFRELDLRPSLLGSVSMLVCKLAAALLFASFTFLLRDKRWLILLSVVIDTWFVANLIYMRNNHILLDAEAFNMSGNLHGYFWSVLIYIEWGIDLMFYGMTLLFCIIFRFIKKTERSVPAWLILIALSVGLRLGAEGLYVADKHTAFDPFPFIREHREPVYGTPRLLFPPGVADEQMQNG